MSLAIVHTRAQNGIDAPQVDVEVHLSNGLPGLSIVGLPEAAVKESKDRVRGALLNANFEFPARRITINLAPADLPKEGGRFDLPIAIGILAASGQIPVEGLSRYEFLGELALSGELRPVRGILPAAIQTRDAGRILVIPEDNCEEAALVEDGEAHAADHLLAVCAHLNGHHLLPRAKRNGVATDVFLPHDLAEVRGQHQAENNANLILMGRRFQHS